MRPNGQARANKSPNKPETELNEFEAILAEHQAKGLEEQALEADVLKKTKAAKKRAAKRGGASDLPTRGSRARRNAAEDDDVEEEDEEEEEEEPVRASRSKVTVKAKPKRAPPKRGEPNIDDEECGVDIQEEGRKWSRARKRRMISMGANSHAVLFWYALSGCTYMRHARPPLQGLHVQRCGGGEVEITPMRGSNRQPDATAGIREEGWLAGPTISSGLREVERYGC